MIGRTPAPFPTRAQVLAFIQASATAVGKREIARHFQIKGEDRVLLKTLLRTLQDDGSVERGRGRRVQPPASLPEVTVIEILGPDSDGELVARPLTWLSEEAPPRITLQPERRGHPALAPGDRVLARLTRVAAGNYLGHTLRRLDPASAATIVGVFRFGPEGARLQSIDKRARAELAVPAAETAGAEPGELVLAELLPSSRLGLKQARVIERLGDSRQPRAFSLIAIHSAGLPIRFPAAAIEEAAQAPAPRLDHREDLRAIPLVTIDGDDARDFDDAVWAESDPDPANPGGWHLLVAIADVAFYVRPGSALDRAARERANSVYFPDRVVPMLPEALSNDLCSLRPGEDRACLAAEMWIGDDGQLRRFVFRRALMRSAARLTYGQVQKAHDGAPDDVTGPLAEPVIAPLYRAFATLAAARRRRGTLDLDLPERQVRLTPDGSVGAIEPRPRFDSHRLVEEFMICANVAAATALEQRQRPCVYRVHAEPEAGKLETLRDFLGSLGYSMPKGQVLRASNLNQILDKAAKTPESRLVSEVILRSQAQAVYQTDNIGHFGLALARYAHFTSPIRRYADLLVHRALIHAFDLGPGGSDSADDDRLGETAEHISVMERRAASAERDALDRFTAAYLSGRVGATFTGRISGVSRFGLFVTLDETGSDGIVPISTLPDDFYDHDEQRHALVGRRHGRLYRLGTGVKVRLIEAEPLIASMVFALLEGGQNGEPRDPAPRDRRSRRP
ncbi:MAG: ribonuclease R [Azospirillaceae bacterium]|nr:ribonuclease R [Azospirillaceae bacterium]